METGFAFLLTIVFMGCLLVSLMTLDELIGGIIKALRPNNEFKFPVGHAIVAIACWTIFYGLHVIGF